MKRVYVARENARDREREYDYLINGWFNFKSILSIRLFLGIIIEYMGKYNVKNRRHRDLFDTSRKYQYLFDIYKINSQLMKNCRLTITAS